MHIHEEFRRKEGEKQNFDLHNNLHLRYTSSSLKRADARTYVFVINTHC